MMPRVYAALARWMAVGMTPLCVMACGAPPLSAAPSQCVASRRVVVEAPPFGPARYVLVGGYGVTFDEASSPSAQQRVEPALIDGIRATLDHGLIVTAKRADEGLRGFRSIPPRLGGGFFFWSRDRTFRAADFFAPLSPLAEVAASGGVRPWLTSIWLRTDRGIVAIDPGTGDQHDVTLPGLADGFALDPLRAVRVDTFGRASVTTDGGATFVDVLATRGVFTTSLREAALSPAIELLGTSGSVELALGPSGELGPPAKPPSQEGEVMLPAVALGLPSVAERVGVSSSQSLASELLPHAVVRGLRIADAVIVASEEGIRAFSLRDGSPTAARDALDVARCQPFRVERGVALACLGDGGGHLRGVDERLVPGPIDAVFVDPGAFVDGGRGRLAFEGRCGPTPPIERDLVGAQTNNEDADRPGGLPSDADVRACVRLDGGAWVERGLEGDDARRLLRWIPGVDGQITALVLTRGSASQASSSHGDLRVIRVDPNDPALLRGVFPMLPREERSPIDSDAWVDDRGDVRTWILLPEREDEDDDEASDDASEEREALPETLAGWPPRLLPVTAQLEGRFAGVTIAPDGAVSVHPLPRGTVSVVRGGPFALARAEREEGPDQTYESVDGGRSWRLIAGPPAGALRGGSPLEGVGCSEVGCSWGDSIVRLGWGGDAPAPREPSLEDDAPLRSPPRWPTLTCVIEAFSKTPKPRRSLLPTALVRAQDAFGPVRVGDSEVTLDGERGLVSLRQGELAMQLFRLPNVVGVERFQLTLGRGEKGPAIVGSSNASGRVFAGALDLGGVSVGPLEPLGDALSLTSSAAPACRSLSPTHRFIAETRIAVRVRDRAGASLVDTTLDAVGRFSADRLTLCVDGVEARLPLQGEAGRIELSATFAKAPAAELRDGPRVARATCAIERAAPQ